MNQFQDRLKGLKDASGKTQVRIAEEIGVTPQAFSYYINGREPDYDTLLAIARYFNVSIDYLLGKSDTKQLNHAEALKALGLSESTQSFFESLNQRTYAYHGLYLLLLNELLSNPGMAGLLHNIINYLYPERAKALSTNLACVNGTTLGIPPDLPVDFIVGAYRSAIEQQFFEFISNAKEVLDKSLQSDK